MGLNLISKKFFNGLRVLGILIVILQFAPPVQAVEVTMRDSTKLNVTFEVPGEGRYPAVLSFGHRWWVNDEKTAKFKEARYAVVKTDPRGLQFHHDLEDGYDLVEWISKQSWCNGKVAMFGISRSAASQWGTAASGHPALKAIFPTSNGPEPWRRQYRDHGAIQLAHAMNGRAVEGNSKAPQWWHLPILDMGNHFPGGDNEAWENYVTHSEYDEYWQKIDLHDKYSKIKCAVYQSTGWWDNYPTQDLNAWVELENAGIIKCNRVRINNNAHYGDGKELDEAIRFFNYILKGEDDGFSEEPPVNLYVQEENKWRGFYNWPPKESKELSYYFHSSGSLNGEKPGQEPASQYTYDPKDPAPTIGTQTSAAKPEVKDRQADIKEVYDREDVVKFVTDRLTEDTDVIGPVRVKLYAASDATDTDFIGRLVDIHPDGKVMDVADGIIRARFRKSIWEEPELITPGEILEYNIDLEGTAYHFKAGHKIGVIITSSSFPFWDRNPNTGGDIATETRSQVARQTIYHDEVHPSHIILPVLPTTRKHNSAKTEKLLIDTGEITLPDSINHRKGWPGAPEEYHHYWDLPAFNWCSPVNYAEGTLEPYFELIDQPGDKTWTFHLMLDETNGEHTKYNGHHWGISFNPSGPKVYTLSKPMTSLRDATNLIPEGLANPKLLRLLLANQSGPGENIPFSNKDFYPMKVRVIWVVVAKGSTFSGWDNYIGNRQP